MSMTNEQIDAATLDECFREIEKLKHMGFYPFSRTIDAIAGAMPEEASIQIFQFGDERVPERRWRCNGYGCSTYLGTTHAETELLARARLLVKVLQAVAPPVA